MKFLQYLKEDYKDLTDIISVENILTDKIGKECKPYLNLLKRDNLNGFYRGMEILYDWGRKDVRQDRKGRLFKGDKAKVLNDWLVKHGGADRSKSVIASTDFDHVSYYFGSHGIFYIFPIGNFKYSYIKGKDLNFKNVSFQGKEYDSIASLQDWQLESGDFKFEKYFVNNKDIKEAYWEKYEIWFQCEAYYFINHVNNEKIEKFLESYNT